MKEKFNELFPYGIDLELSGMMQIQNRCDELTEEQVLYIENSTYMFEDMYRMLESLSEDYGFSSGVYKDIQSLLSKARGE